MLLFVEVGGLISNAIPNQYDMGSTIKNIYESDLNNVPDDKYMFGIIGSGMNLKNSPFGNHNQYMINYPSPFNFAMQLNMDFDGTLGIRCKNNGKWNEWSIFHKQ